MYLFSKGTVKPANQKFTSIKNDYSLTFGPYADISEVKDDGDIVETSFDFVSLKQIKDMIQEGSVDVIGIVNSISEVTEVKLKTGNSKAKRVIDILDNSAKEGMLISFTIWGDLCTSLQVKEGDVIGIKGGKVSFYSG